MARPVTELQSSNNPLIKEVRRAVSRSAATRDGLWVAESFHLLDEALASRVHVRKVLVSARRRREAEIRLRGHTEVDLNIVDDGLFDQIASTETSQGVIALVEPPRWGLDDLFRDTPLVIVLDTIQDPGNVGTIVRTAEAFGTTGIVLLKGTAHAANPKTLRASAGSLFRLPFAQGFDSEVLIAEFQKRELPCFAASVQGSKGLGEATLERGCGVVLGSEAHGVSPAWRAASEEVRIPTKGVESLNVAAAAAVVLYEAARRRGAQGGERNGGGAA